MHGSPGAAGPRRRAGARAGRVRCRTVWEPAALEAAVRFLEDDPEGLRQLLESADLLPGRPRPPGTAAYGSPHVRRMHVGRYRLLYRVGGAASAKAAITVLHVGRVA
ncbi:type II toxin-antitoxin system RelE/ParE family toxin [Streptomyces racemochromogenes]|uniref:Type II toxin-antitoxin system RelE/ParE family toxin n=1 Tax=Streptomyces racemochromogenes TaxID=67353 RepID=A0ABW7PEE9_9ACTN